MKSQQFGRIEVLTPICDLSTINDGRGAIFTWLPTEPLLEFNLVIINPNKVRGNHLHKEFVEYFLVTSGTGLFITSDPETDQTITWPASSGQCFRIPTESCHAFHAITEVRAISMLTKPWEECKEPVTRKNLYSSQNQQS